MAVNVAMILPGSTSQAAGRLVLVPDVTAQDEAGARQAYEDVGLIPRFRQVESPGAPGAIIRQDPAAGEPRARRSVGTIYITVAAPATPAQLDARFDKLDAAVNDVKKAVDAVSPDVAAVKTDVATVKTDVAAVKTDVASVKGDVTAVKADTTAVKSGVTKLGSSVTTISRDLGSVDREVKGVRAVVDKLAKPIAKP
jgi:hypothetical protein